MSDGEEVEDMPQSTALQQAECRLRVVKRVAQEAMTLLTDEQLTELKHRLDALDAGEEPA